MPCFEGDIRQFVSRPSVRPARQASSQFPTRYYLPGKKAHCAARVESGHEHEDIVLCEHHRVASRAGRASPYC